MILLRAAITFSAILIISCRKPSLVRLHTATWNVGKIPPPDDINEFLGINNNTRKVHLIAIGVQGLKKDKTALPNNNWQQTVNSKLEKEGYFQIHAYTMGSIGQYIYALNNYKSDLNTSTIDTFDVDLIENKMSAIVTSFHWLGRSFLFVSSHFPGTDRNKVDNKYLYYFYVLFSFIDTFDFQFWLGSLNFMVQLKPNEGEKLVQQGNLTQLLKFDQLTIARRTNKAFMTWYEQEINFLPNYKFQNNTDKYNFTKTPSWTDRILYRTDSGRTIAPGKHEKLDKHKNTIRRPVMCKFTLYL